MKITKFEQSGFIIENKNGYKLAIDIAAYTPAEKLEGINVDAMIVSHIHGDHFNVEQIKKLSPKKLYLNHECIEVLGEEELSSEIIQIKTGDIVDVDGITVECFDVDHGPNVTVRPLENFGFLINVDGEKVYFSGDMFYSSGLDVSNLEVDYALIPVGGYYTFGPQEAFDHVKKFKNIKNVVPMHYEKTNNTKDEFISLASGENFKVLSI
ncbi:MAG: MBL fold metallo-hydrolase [Candidatus Pacebacteria bacterium]|nr:MBL fold metallo-hydrolase [Candidatus Paceibacterota bacterium]MBP9715923.1 MBL fold metallo-hydrolase [Candidatus Paceibacterota bacterium]